MSGIRAAIMLLLCLTLAMSAVPLAMAAEQKPMPISEYQGQIKSVKIDYCGMQPGTCEGSIIVSQANGREVTLAIKPGTWIKRGDQYVLIEDLGVGNYVHVRAAKIGGAERATDVDVLTSPG